MQTKMQKQKEKKRGINSHNKFRTEESFKGLHCVIIEKKNPTQNKKIVDTKVDTEISIIIIIIYKPG